MSLTAGVFMSDLELTEQTCLITLDHWLVILGMGQTML